MVKSVSTVSAGRVTVTSEIQWASIWRTIVIGTTIARKADTWLIISTGCACCLALRNTDTCWVSLEARGTSWAYSSIALFTVIGAGNTNSIGKL